MTNKKDDPNCKCYICNKSMVIDALYVPTRQGPCHISCWMHITQNFYEYEMKWYPVYGAETLN